MAPRRAKEQLAAAVAGRSPPPPSPSVPPEGVSTRELQKEREGKKVKEKKGETKDEFQALFYYISAMTTSILTTTPGRAIYSYELAHIRHCQPAYI